MKLLSWLCSWAALLAAGLCSFLGALARFPGWAGPERINSAVDCLWISFLLVQSGRTSSKSRKLTVSDPKSVRTAHQIPWRSDGATSGWDFYLGANVNRNSVCQDLNTGCYKSCPTSITIWFPVAKLHRFPCDPQEARPDWISQEVTYNSRGAGYPPWDLSLFFSLLGKP